MKNFLGMFGMTFIVCGVFIFFGGALIFENFWAAIAVVAFLLSIFITALLHQETKIEELEERMKTLEVLNEHCNDDASPKIK